MLQVVIKHTPFVDGFDVEYLGNSEMMDHQELLDWFKAAGAKNLEKVNEAINHAWNFGMAQVVIAEPSASLTSLQV
jgi:hypothetical protein